MKKTVRLLSLLLALVLTCSLLPLAALAEETGGSSGGTTPPPAPATATVTVYAYCLDTDSTLGGFTATISAPTTFDANTFGPYISGGGKIYEYVFGGTTIDPKNGDAKVVLSYTIHYHNYLVGYNRENHWEACRCGSTLSFDKHVDPAKDDDSICTCGYKFSDNANLTYLWMNDMSNQPFFNKDITEYQCTVYAYNNSPTAVYSYQAFDTKATVTEPKDKTLRDGINVYEFTVTAEDKKTTKTYTVYVSKPSTLDYITVYSDGTVKDGFTTKLEPHAIYLNNTASVTLPKAIGEMIAFQASNAKSKQVVMDPVCNRWGVEILYINIPGKVLEEVSTSDADFIIRTYFGNIEIPNAELKKLGGEGENLKFTLTKEDGNGVLTITADDKEVKNNKVTLTAPDK